MVPQLTHVALLTLDAYAAHGEVASHQRGFSGILSFAGADGWLGILWDGGLPCVAGSPCT